jgi:hypothetical protein
MKSIYKLAAVSAVFSALAFIAAPGSAEAAAFENHPGGAYCLEGDHYGSGDCSFKTYDQCEASASGTTGECMANVFDRDDSSL